MALKDWLKTAENTWQNGTDIISVSVVNRWETSFYTVKFNDKTLKTFTSLGNALKFVKKHIDE